MTRNSPKALFAVSSLGLGHATRTLVVIREYLRRGYAYGISLFDRLTQRPLVRRLVPAGSYEKGVAFFRRRGAAAVLIARLSGPLSWITPAMAGTFHLDYGVFLRFNTLGVLLGIGQFIVVGYFFGSHLNDILGWLDRFGITIFACVLIAASVVVLRARSTLHAK